MMKMIAKNRKAYHNYTIETKHEAGIVLQGTEVKSCVSSKVDLSDGYIAFEGNRVVLKNIHIAKYANAGYADHEEKRDRFLLLNRHEIRKLKKAITEKGYTLIPLIMYFHSKTGKIKLEIGLCKGKKQFDKRETLKQRQQELDIKREAKTL